MSRGGYRCSVRQHATLALLELRAYVMAYGWTHHEEQLRAILERHLQHDDDLVEDILSWR